MQVEIIEAFGANLSQAAWYRFPFMDMLAMYFATLAKEAVIVQQKRGSAESRARCSARACVLSRHAMSPFVPPCWMRPGAPQLVADGFKKAFLSGAALYDVVPGIIMAFYFGQLHVLGAPLRAMWGAGATAEDYAKENTGDKAPLEQLVVTTGATVPDWRQVDDRISDIRQLLPELFTMMVPTFKPLTEVLLKLSQVQPGLEVLQISNQLQVQVRVQLRLEQQLELLRSKKGLEVMFEYRFPVDGTGTPPPRSVSLCVEVPYLLGVLRFCQQHGVRVMQVYDFWS
jgi:hypothetical protein